MEAGENTMIRRTTPFDDIDRLFDRMTRGFGEMDLSPMGGIDVDVADYDDEYVLMADLPGFDREDISVTVDDQIVTISAERAMSADDADAEGMYLRRERRSESTSRRVRLPEAVDEGGVTASYRNGVLAVTLPKLVLSDDDRGRRIDIE